jgi:hypothetical protein
MNTNSSSSRQVVYSKYFYTFIFISKVNLPPSSWRMDPSVCLMHMIFSRTVKVILRPSRRGEKLPRASQTTNPFFFFCFSLFFQFPLFKICTVCAYYYIYACVNCKSITVRFDLITAGNDQELEGFWRLFGCSRTFEKLEGFFFVPSTL